MWAFLTGILAKVRPQIFLIILVVGVLAWKALDTNGVSAKDIISLVVIAIVSLGKDLIQLDKDNEK
jgi:hypothetical protein